MNILVLGNGFDLAHNLPTKYKDFLHFTRVVKELLNCKFEDVNWDGINDEIRELLIENTRNNRGNLYTQKKEWLEMLENNFWLYHFECSFIKDGWIDFESEISRVIQLIDEDITDGSRARLTVGYNVASEAVEVKYGEQMIFKFENTSQYDEDKLIEDACHKILEGLNKLIRALEMYLLNYVEKTKIKIFSPDIKEIEVDKVLSFNYTDTYEQYYDESQTVEYDFIHGKAEFMHDLETNNMVLGIDEYLPDDRKDKEVEFIAYKKYYQCIFKGTGCLYKNWAEDMKNRTYKNTPGNASLNAAAHQLYIFGHSLDVTDKDVLKELIVNDWVDTTIFYLDRADFGRKIANLVKVIGQGELIKRTGGPSKTITFKLQKPMESIKSNNR